MLTNDVPPVGPSWKLCDLFKLCCSTISRVSLLKSASFYICISPHMIIYEKRIRGQLKYRKAIIRHVTSVSDFLWKWFFECGRFQNTTGYVYSHMILSYFRFFFFFFMKGSKIATFHWFWSVRVAERLALPTSDHGVAGSNPAGGEILPEPKRRFIAQSLSCSPSHRLEMTEILLKGRKILIHPSIHPLVSKVSMRNFVQHSSYMLSYECYFFQCACTSWTNETPDFTMHEVWE